MDATLQAEKRDGAGQERGAAAARARAHSGGASTAPRRARRSRSPSIRRRCSRILHSESGVNTLIGLERSTASGDTRVLVKEYQLDPIDHKLLHADFYQVAMDKLLTVTVPIVLKGEAKGVKQQGGIVDFVNREIEIEVLPGDIPENIDVDVSELMLNQGVRVRDLPTEGAKWKPVSDADMMIVHVVTPKAEEEAPAADAAAAAPGAPAEPEVIKKGKTDKDRREVGRTERRAADEARRRPRQPRPEVRGHAAQRRVRGGRRAGGAARAGVGGGAGRGARWRKWRRGRRRCSPSR